MADRPKKKQQSGTRNPDRRNGKAPKKHPKPQRVLSPEERAERDRLAAERRVAAREAREAEARRRERQKLHALARMQGEAIQMNKEFDAARRRQADRAFIAKLAVGQSS